MWQVWGENTSLNFDRGFHTYNIYIYTYVYIPKCYGKCTNTGKTYVLYEKYVHISDDKF